MTDIVCQVESMEPLTPTVSAITLKPDVEVSFLPGQYLEVVMGEKDRRPFSIANAPRSDNKLELHIGSAGTDVRALEVLKRMKSGSISITSAQGKAHFRPENTKPMILVAGGTGYSYIRSVLHAALDTFSADESRSNITLYWGTRSLEDMYEYAELTKLAQAYQYFTFVPVLEEPPENWHSHIGWVHQAVLDDFSDLQPYTVYIAGRFEMAAVARDDFTQKGLLKEHLFGDAFAFI